jgi:hypothetical protein
VETLCTRRKRDIPIGTEDLRALVAEGRIGKALRIPQHVPGAQADQENSACNRE